MYVSVHNVCQPQAELAARGPPDGAAGTNLNRAGPGGGRGPAGGGMGGALGLAVRVGYARARSFTY